MISNPKKSKANYWITGITGAKQEAGKNYVQVEWWNDPDKEPLAKDWLEEAEVRNLGSTSNDMVDDYYKLASTAAENGDDLQNLPQAGDQTKPTLTADQPRQKTAYLATRRRDMIANADLTPSSVYDGINDCENCRMNHFRRFSDNFGREKSLANIYGSKPKNEWTELSQSQSSEEKSLQDENLSLSPSEKLPKGSEHMLQHGAANEIAATLSQQAHEPSTSLNPGG